MAEIIHIRDHLRPAVPENLPPFRIRLCGPDLRWAGLVGSILAGALQEGGLLPSLESFESHSPLAVLDLVAETGAPFCPGLLVTTGGIPESGKGYDACTVLLLPAEAAEVSFPGRILPLPPAGPAATSLELACACAGGAGRLLGIGWPTFERSCRQELCLAAGASPDHHLTLASAVFQHLSAWAGTVPGLRENDR